MPKDAFKNLFPDTRVLLDLPPEELAISLLAFLNSLPPRDRRSVRYSNFIYTYIREVYQHPESDEVILAIREAWAVLTRDGLTAIIPDSTDSYFITKRGASVTSPQDIETYRKASLLPNRLLRADLAAYVLSDFNRGDYEAAIFKAFKHVEVTVRKAGGFTNADIGTKLMRKAFGPTGPLADKTVVDAEQLAIADLFAGAIGAYKNPSSHRYVSFTDPGVAVELILAANHLLRIVDDRVSALKAPPLP